MSEIQLHKQDIETVCPKCKARYATASQQGVAVDYYNECMRCRYGPTADENGRVNISEQEMTFLEQKAVEREDQHGKVAVNCIRCAQTGNIIEACPLCHGRGWMLAVKVKPKD